MLILALLLFAQHIDSTAPRTRAPRSVAIDERLAEDYGVHLGDRIVVSGTTGGAGDTVVVGGIVRRRADPSEVSRGEYRVRMHLDQLQDLLGYGDRVDRFAVGTRSDSATTI